jgi:hypothetical protein
MSSVGTARILASSPDSSSMRSRPTGRQVTTTPDTTGTGITTITSVGSPSPHNVCGM